MNNRRQIREVLGITQLDTAILIKTTKSLFSMFEIGQRDLPVKAQLKLVQMYEYVKNSPSEKILYHDLKNERDKTIAILEKELSGYELKILTEERELNRLQRNYQKGISTLLLVEYLKTKLSENEKPTETMIKWLHIKGLKAVSSNGLSLQIQKEIKIKSLQYEKNELLKTLEKF